MSYLKSRRSYNTQPQDHQISDDNPFKTFGSCHSWMIIDCYHLLFPLMLRKHSGAALALHLFSNLRSPTGLKCRAVTGGLDSSDRFFLYTAAIKELGAACVCNCFVSSYSFKCMPKVVSSDHNFVWQNFLINSLLFHSKSWRIHPKNKPKHITFGQQIQTLKYHEMTISNSIKQLRVSAVKELETMSPFWAV